MANDTWAARYQMKLNKYSDKCKGCNCILWNGCTERGKRVNYGQICAKILKDESGLFEFHTLKVHRLQFMVMLGDPSQIKEKDMHVSHLCFSHLCIEPSHLSYEPAEVNISRDTCRQDNLCYGHAGFSDCILCKCAV